ncbi:hypothetical protein O179_04400 [Chlamydia trachomatis]|nr:hypothetical protein E150_04205 [Chlamydia trachomatis E/150]ADH18512.1 hypothetical protein G9768_04175 [Chlamydia trachomatis G/9768]ADH19438.1 hypothetical protein G11222_04200 [Chlamydia trachomatis G/11222]ADH20358.1 hypothetical protein G11074_04170 [Chlamydia trachomatis G/11074]ADH21282.1 hypothetical protein E11023_04170 [Chlamydia trachomatis E/11023]ADH97456.1 hypothetical protein CTG9301_04185 [Chlamydia trachomatis G/9301]AGO32776.1 hypothetical protein CTLINITIAL_04825 [Chlam
MAKIPKNIPAKNQPIRLRFFLLARYAVSIPRQMYSKKKVNGNIPEFMGGLPNFKFVVNNHIIS